MSLPLPSLERNSGSYRDPGGQVYSGGDRIFRTVLAGARDNYEHMRNAGIIEESVAAGRIVATRELPAGDWSKALPGAHYLLEHEKIPFISYPYEWTFSALKAAALHHLDFQLDLFDRGYVLSDASAYNIQFLGSKPIFIDILSIRPYRPGEYWNGFRQFLEQFLNPLALNQICGVAHNGWYRGSLEGISSGDLAKILPLRSRLSWRVWAFIFLMARSNAHADAKPSEALAKAGKAASLSPSRHRGLMRSLRNWIASMTMQSTERSTWANYATENTYTSAEFEEKKKFVAAFTDRVRPDFLLDIGCNSGDYSLVALESGAKRVVGFDFDQQALERAFSRSQQRQAHFLPLWLDASNPSPDQGWLQTERRGFADRARADASLALAVEHHLAVAKNIQLPEVVRWIVDRAPLGVVEFVPKTDPTVQIMLTLKGDIFPDYTEDQFKTLLERHARIVESRQISASGRTLYFFDRS